MTKATACPIIWYRSDSSLDSRHSSYSLDQQVLWPCQPQLLQCPATTIQPDSQNLRTTDPISFVWQGWWKFSKHWLLVDFEVTTILIETVWYFWMVVVDLASFLLDAWSVFILRLMSYMRSWVAEMSPVLGFQPLKSLFTSCLSSDAQGSGLVSQSANTD